MKTAISMDDGLLLEADRTAKVMGVSRSRLFARAIDEFLERQRQEQMLRQLNEVYAGPTEPVEKTLLKAMKKKFRKNRERPLVNEVRQGEVYWLDLGPAIGSAPAELHPCVVVQNDLFNQSAISTTVVCLITSNLTRANAPGNMLLKKGEATLQKASVVNVSQIQTVDKSDLDAFAGKLSSSAIAAIRQGLQLLFVTAAL